MPEPPLLLHSLVHFRELILRCLEVVDARRILEIGSESGQFTLELADWAARRDGTVVSIDPEPAERLRERAESQPNLQLVACASPEALQGVERGDVHVIDGDHNYWTVLHELRHAYADAAAGEGPLCILHDVSWPSGRRDMYYAPDRLPPEAVHPHAFEGGALPGRSELGPGGFWGAGSFAWACHEGGERNGVLTAVEDTLEAHPGLRFARVPCIFGLGFVWPARSPWSDTLAAELAPYADNPLLVALEENRLALYLRLLQWRELPVSHRARADRVIADLHAQIAVLEAENARFRLDTAQGQAADD